MLRTCTECKAPAYVFSFWGQPMCLCRGCHRTRLDRVKVMIERLLEVK